MNIKKIILVTSFIYTSLFSIQSFANEKFTIMLEWFVNPNHGPIVVAKQNGYFKELGLDVEIQEPGENASMANKMVAAGKVDMAVSYEPGFLVHYDSGLPIKQSGTLLSSTLTALLVLDNSDIHSIEDLKGRTIGVYSIESTHAILLTMLKHSNMTFDDVKLVRVGWNLSSALATKKVDAIWDVMRTFEVVQLNLNGVKVRAFYPEENGVPHYEELIFIVNNKKGDSSKIRKFNQAIARAAQFIVNHPQESWEIFVSYNKKILDTELNKKVWFDTVNKISLRPSAIDYLGYQNFAQILYDNKSIKKLVDPMEYFKR